MKNFVIFGASGDLAKNYLFPALKNLQASGHQFNCYGFARSNLDQSVINNFGLTNFTYISGQYDLTGLSQLSSYITSDTIYYFALPTEINLIKNIITILSSLSLISSKTKLVIEKPFGSNYSTAKKLMDFFDQKNLTQSVFLVDHYLTKNLVKNIISLRFANPIFSHLWNKKYIKEINITATETQGINNRGNYYDQTGAIRDMVQNHLLQLLALITMDSPLSFNYSDFVAKKVDIFSQNYSFFASSWSISKLPSGNWSRFSFSYRNFCQIKVKN